VIVGIIERNVQFTKKTFKMRKRKGAKGLEGRPERKRSDEKNDDGRYPERAMEEIRRYSLWNSRLGEKSDRGEEEPLDVSTTLTNILSFLLLFLFPIFFLLSYEPPRWPMDAIAVPSLGHHIRKKHPQCS
jgi:hypothetical protein